jgi:hypothetical protein
MGNFMGMGHDNPLDEIGYFLHKIELSKIHLRSYLKHYNYGSLYDASMHGAEKEIFDLISIQNQCTRLKGEAIKLEIVLKDYIKI